MKAPGVLGLFVLLFSAASVSADPVHLAPRADSSAYVFPSRRRGICCRETLTSLLISESVLENQFHLTSVATGATLTSLANALQSAASSISTRSDVISANSVAATAIPTSVIQSISESGFPHIVTTAQPAWFSKLPNDVKSNYLSQESVLGSIATHVLKITATTGITGTTSNPGVPRATGEVVIAGAVAAGVLGVMAML